jgi:hypothetical protein
MIMLLGFAYGYVWAGVGAVILAAIAIALAGRNKARRLAPWKQLRNSMTPEEVKALLGEPRKVIPLDNGQNWDYGTKPYQAAVIFTNDRVTGFIKPF